MKTIDELNALIPTIIDLMYEEDMEFGNNEEDECELNFFSYQEDGWLIEIDYSCSADFYTEPQTWDYPGYCEQIRQWGWVEEIRASHFDKETMEKTEFDDNDTIDLYNAVNKFLESL